MNCFLDVVPLYSSGTAQFATLNSPWSHLAKYDTFSTVSYFLSIPQLISFVCREKSQVVTKVKTSSGKPHKKIG